MLRTTPATTPDVVPVTLTLSPDPLARVQWAWDADGAILVGASVTACDNPF